MNQIPPFAEKGFRWMRETIALIYEHHRHPLPMTALIFMYAETHGKPLTENSKSEAKTCAFIQVFMPNLWKAFEWSPKREVILGNHYRNGLAHQIFMKQNAGIHEDNQGDPRYVVQKLGNIPYSINIDRLVPEFLEGTRKYFERLGTDVEFFNRFVETIQQAQPDAQADANSPQTTRPVGAA